MDEASRRPRRQFPWGPPQVGLGVILGVSAYALSLLTIAGVAAATGHRGAFEDVGDIFAKASVIAEYADERLQAAALGDDLPDPPAVVGDVATARVAYALGVFHGLLLVAAVFLAVRKSPARVWEALGLSGYNINDIWRPILLAAGAYILVALYTVLVIALGIDFLQPADSLPRTILRDDWAMVFFGMTAVIAAPVGEEFFFRGLVFGGLLRWGFWPAALISAVFFSVSHIDPGTMIPFAIVGVLLAWIFYSRGSLWDAIIMHAAFNGASFAILALSR